jgi:NitT/TauT family transport system substrate-binding protein
MRFKAFRIFTAAAVLWTSFGALTGARSEEVLKLAIGQRGNWDTSVAEIGQRMGIFKKHNLQLEILYTQGGGETQQAVISGSVDVGVAAGMMGVLGAFSKGAPVRILGAETTGAADLFWYVRADSPIQSLKDANGRTMSYSTNGSSTHGIVTAFIKQESLSAKPVSTGGPASTLTQVMSGQIDIGWAAPPFGLDQLDQKQIRIVASGNDAQVFKGQTVRLLIANAQTLQARGNVLKEFMVAYRETIDAMYAADPSALKTYADWLGISESKAKRVRDDFFPKAALDPDQIVGLKAIVEDAVQLKYTATALTQAQLDELVKIPARN